ncbi:MAG: C40 family peptidase [Lutibacter sp.]|jgi:hypothetical protein
MKLFISLKKPGLFIIAILFLSSCSQNKSAKMVSEIGSHIDSLKQIYAPDGRIALWNISIDNEANGITLTGEVESEKAQSDILNLSSKYPGIKIDCKLLPKNELGVTSFALVNNSVATIRATGKHVAEIVNQSLLGTPVKVFKKEGGWYLIQTPNHYFGWINQASIVLLDSARLKEMQGEKKIMYYKQFGFSYSSPDSKSQTVSDLVIGCILPAIGEDHAFYKVKYPDNRIAFVKKDEVKDLNLLFNKTPQGNELVETAKKFLGIPYLWGGFSSKAIDCSGFTSTIYFLNGIILQRDASQQSKCGKEITSNFDYSSLLAGDLMFFGRRKSDSLPEKVTHAAMYIGEGNFIQSSGNVRITNMDSSRLDYESNFVRAIRIIGQENGKTIQRISDNESFTILKSN